VQVKTTKAMILHSRQQDKCNEKMGRQKSTKLLAAYRDGVLPPSHSSANHNWFMYQAIPIFHSKKTLMHQITKHTLRN